MRKKRLKACKEREENEVSCSSAANLVYMDHKQPQISKFTTSSTLIDYAVMNK
jgi:hypothetical protein